MLSSAQEKAIKELSKAVAACDYDKVRGVLARHEGGCWLNEIVQGKKFNYTPIVDAIRAGNIELTGLFLDHGFDINAAGVAGFDPGSTMMYLATFGVNSFEKIQYARFLLGRGANPNGVFSRPLCGAAYSGFTEMAEMLIAAGADVNLHESYQLDKMGSYVVDFQMKDPDRISYLGEAPLHYAVQCSSGLRTNTDYPGVVRLLINKGADVNSFNLVRRTPLMIAIRSRNDYRDEVKLVALIDEVIDILKENGAK